MQKKETIKTIRQKIRQHCSRPVDMTILHIKCRQNPLFVLNGRTKISFVDEIGKSQVERVTNYWNGQQPLRNSVVDQRHSQRIVTRDLC